MEAEAIKQMRSGESAVEEHLKTHRKLQAAEADLAQLRERVEGLERALEGLLFMTINGVLCQEEDACSHCKPLWKRARTALEPPPPDTQEDTNG